MRRTGGGERAIHGLVDDGHAVDRRVLARDAVGGSGHFDEGAVGQQVEDLARAVEQTGLLIEGVVRDEHRDAEAAQRVLAGDHGHVGEGALGDRELPAHGLGVVGHGRGPVVLKVGELHVGEHEVPVVGKGTEDRGDQHICLHGGRARAQRDGGAELVADADLAREALVGEPAGRGAEVFDEGVEGDDFVARGAVAGVVEGEGGIAGATQCTTE